MTSRYLDSLLLATAAASLLWVALLSIRVDYLMGKPRRTRFIGFLLAMVWLVVVLARCLR